VAIGGELLEQESAALRAAVEVERALSRLENVVPPDPDDDERAFRPHPRLVDGDSATRRSSCPGGASGAKVVRSSGTG
jgi:hypothetical protein